MSTSYNRPSYTQPQRSGEVLRRGNELLQRLVERRQDELSRALQNAEVGGNASIARHGVIPSAGQPEQSAPQNVIHAENYFGAYNQAPTVVQPTPQPHEMAQQPDPSFETPSVEESRATVNQIFDEITQARQEWHVQDQDDVSQGLGNAA